MNIPQIENPNKYIGLYVIDFGDHSAVGYTADEVAMILESERYADAKVYKIHRARPDGTLELAGVAREKFISESGMFFHCTAESEARDAYRTLHDFSQQQAPPCRARLHLVEDADEYYVGLIYPAEYEDDIGRWLAASGFRGRGPVDAGISQVERYYARGFNLIEHAQLWPEELIRSRNREDVFAAVGAALQR